MYDIITVVRIWLKPDAYLLLPIAYQMLPFATILLLLSGKELWYSYTGIDLQSDREISVALFFLFFDLV